MIVQTYEDRIKEAMLENSELRDSLVVLETELAAMLNATPGLGSLPASPSRPRAPVAAAAVPAIAGDTDGAAASAPSPLKPGHFALPFAASRDGIEQSLKLRMASLKDRFLQLSAEAAASGKADVAEVTQLQAQLDECTIGLGIAFRRHSLWHFGISVSLSQHAAPRQAPFRCPAGMHTLSF